MILLIPVAGLFGRYRFVTTVTILQQTWKVIVDLGRMGALQRDENARGDSQGNPLAPAEELGKRWRFFPTYAGV
jgi:hypothetical protein